MVVRLYSSPPYYGVVSVKVNTTDCDSVNMGSIPIHLPKVLALLIIMVVDWFCNPGVVVRFHQGAPILSRIRLAAMPLRLGRRLRRFESYMRDQVLLKCQQENVTLVNILRRCWSVEGDGFNSRLIGRSAQIGCYLD